MKDQWKWLLLIPVVAAMVFLALFVPKWLSSGSADNTDTTGDNQAIQLEIEQKQGTIDLAQQQIDSDSQNIAAIKILADAYLEKGLLQQEDGDVNGSYRSFKSAVDAYRQYLAITPDDYEVRVDLGYTYYNLAMFMIAERELKTVTESAPSNQRAWHVYGVVLSREGSTDEAVAAWQKSYDLDPDSTVGQESKQFIEQAQSGQISVPPTP
jgi:tetratricopeptide (TPR) repeat protein